MQVPGHVFREYDIRGVADTELSERARSRHRPGLRAWPSSRALREAGSLRIAVGRDCRLSSPRLFDALVDGLMRTGARRHRRRRRPHAAALLRRAPPRHRRRRDDHREPQPGRRERLQDDARQGAASSAPTSSACATRRGRCVRARDAPSGSTRVVDVHDAYVERSCRSGIDSRGAATSRSSSTRATAPAARSGSPR